ncbi:MULTISPECIES: SIS domain-containing protein [unclassified Breznakia]|uniref:SIS domain-containing protein n=1 Tax=unclassified Breznakia TaxID=2623764 RepID=UPI00247388F7|nr:MULTISPECIES: SIS domain-containing protein [unclassified Breznakia]MDH6366499.1 tagatose-6-phosphate ketose/aldose isomerase [Breznakia sp. PH1-1]MDH6403592.1 tagatose-6-phosphate ketose/aldose isomerase [Breznakia sp. PF1-11]MDH6411301.1 tagatose-6-phosphate ketose/aldose isomerase [Breznakia sp. PFB1-11]MDH6413723.1 tagatose-6-phosphate ketose/aldose isomerase [Breznakia sp. PFB1-14]MDH6415846.1 tagatose-6-phosphate ketose/aldose isomerase [Breznakia sp. PFB1-4]
MIYNVSIDELKKENAFWTASEIHQQPETWKKTLAQVESEKDAIQAFINKVITQDDFDVILTGAGTSEFVGNAVFSYLNTKLNNKARSYATTDIVACPENYLSRTKPTLLISYGRSGNSPESVAAVEVANVVCENIYHLFITCNHEGALSEFAKGKDNCYAINLTPETHDQSFAMTSSFSNMYLATVLSFNLDNLEEMKNRVDAIVAGVDELVNEQYTFPEMLVSGFDFKRIVYLGSNTNKGVAQESALKMLELTAGEVVTMYDTPLGFRHGPKSIIDPETLTVVYLSDDAYTRQYEIDILKEMSPQRKGNKILAISSSEDEQAEELVDYFYSFDNKEKLENVFLGLEYITMAQLIAYYKSLSLEKTPDNPCPTGEVNRVVKGVTIYPYVKK